MVREHNGVGVTRVFSVKYDQHQQANAVARAKHEEVRAREIKLAKMKHLSRV